MAAVAEPTEITTPSWYTFDVGRILPDVPNAVVVSTSTCKHELPNRLFVGKREEGAWMTGGKNTAGKEVYVYRLQPLGRELTAAEKSNIYDEM